nr:retrovirus-related Pol polyprotein from transposon TNT 1-94 [Tanacetum cinerariifolium]
MTDYALWEVILNGDSPPPTRSIEGVKTPYPPITIEEKLARKNELKARDLEALNMDDLYNNLKIYEVEVMGECTASKHQDNKNREAPRRTVPAEDGPTNFTLMAYTSSSSSSSSNSNTEVSTCSKACLKSYETLKEHYDNLTKYFNKSQSNLGAYKAGLESVETRLEVYKKNEAVFIDDIKILKLDVMLRDKAITELRQKFQKAKKEIDDLKLALEKFQDSSKNLRRLLDSQQSDKSKTGLEHDSPGFDSSVLKNQMNEKYNTCEAYHAVPPPYAGNFMPYKPNLVFADEHVVSESVTSLPDIAKSEVKTSETKLKNVSEPIIEDWVSDSEDENKIKTDSKQIKPSFAKEKLVKSTEHVKSPRKSVKQKESNRQTRYPRKTSQSPRVVSVVQGNMENDVKSSACWIWRPTGNVIDHISKDSGSYMLKRFNYVDLQGRLKPTYDWKQVLPTDYQEFDGGFVSFGGSPKGDKIYGKGKIRTGKLDFEDVYFVKELKFNLFSVSQMCDKKNNVFFTEFECLILSPDFKLLDENQVLLKVPRQNNMYGFDLKNVAPSGGIKREFSVARTPQQNRVAKRKNRTLIEAARTMLAELLLPTTFWAEAVNTDCYVQNRVLVTKSHNKTPYELLTGRSPNIDFMKPFGCLVTILNTLDHLGKFKGKADEGFLVGYSVNSKAFRGKLDRRKHLIMNTYCYHSCLLLSTQSLDDKDANEVPGKGDRSVSKGSRIDDQERNASTTQDVNTARPSINIANTNINTGSLNINTVGFNGVYDDEEVGAEADTNNLELSTV